MTRFLSSLLASWFVILVVVAQHLGLFIAMMLGFITAVALVVHTERYPKFRGQNSKRVIVTVLSCLTIVAFMLEASLR